MRLVVDMRRSRANARAAVPKRPVLPRPRDVVADWEELFSEAASLAFTPEAGVSCENVTCGFSDACCHVMVHPEELKNCLVAAGQRIALMCRVGFGSKGATLLSARWSGHAAGRIKDQHVHRRPPPQLAWYATAARQAASGRVTLFDRGGVQGRLGHEIQSGQVDRVRARTRLHKPYGHRQNPNQDRRSFQAGCTGTVKRTDVAVGKAPPAGGKMWLDNESPSQGEMDNLQAGTLHTKFFSCTLHVLLCAFSLHGSRRAKAEKCLSARFIPSSCHP